MERLCRYFARAAISGRIAEMRPFESPIPSTARHQAEHFDGQPDGNITTPSREFHQWRQRAGPGDDRVGVKWHKTP